MSHKIINSNKITFKTEWRKISKVSKHLNQPSLKFKYPNFGWIGWDYGVEGKMWEARRTVRLSLSFWLDGHRLQWTRQLLLFQLVS